MNNIELAEIDDLVNKLLKYSKEGLKESLDIEIESFIKSKDILKILILVKNKSWNRKEKKEEDKRILNKNNRFRKEKARLWS